MWHTSRGDRTLKGAEATLVGAAIDVMMDELSLGFDELWEEDPGWECQTGITLFDSHTPTQRIALLHEAARYLLTDACPSTDPSAAAEAAIAAIFTEVRDQVAIEIDLFPQTMSTPPEACEPCGTVWRSQVIAAVVEVRASEWDGEPEEVDPSRFSALEGDDWEEPAEAGEGIPDRQCRDLKLWEFWIEYLADAILWDRDFELAESFLDADPGLSQQRRRLLGIDEDYFTRITPDPRPEELAGLISQTRALVRAKPR